MTWVHYSHTSEPLPTSPAPHTWGQKKGQLELLNNHIVMKCAASGGRARARVCVCVCVCVCILNLSRDGPDRGDSGSALPVQALGLLCLAHLAPQPRHVVPPMCPFSEAPGFVSSSSLSAR